MRDRPIVENPAPSRKVVCMFRMKFPTKHIFRIFPILRTVGMAPFWNLFMEPPWYYNNETLKHRNLKSFRGCNRPISCTSYYLHDSFDNVMAQYYFYLFL